MNMLFSVATGSFVAGDVIVWFEFHKDIEGNYEKGVYEDGHNIVVIIGEGDKDSLLVALKDVDDFQGIGITDYAYLERVKLENITVLKNLKRIETFDMSKV